MMTPMLMTALALWLYWPGQWAVLWSGGAWPISVTGWPIRPCSVLLVGLIAGMSNQIGMILVGGLFAVMLLWLHTKTAGHGYAARHSGACRLIARSGGDGVARF